MVRAGGRRVRLVDRPFEQPLGRRSAAEVWARQLRWSRLRRHSFVWLFLPESLVGSALPSIALAIVAAHYGFAIAGSFALFLGVWFGAEAALGWRIGWRLSLRTPIALLLRDWLLPLLFVATWVGSDFFWRGTPMRTRGQRELRAPLRILHGVRRRGATAHRLSHERSRRAIEQ